ncbi:MAG: DUF4872 domain-containing protein [Treponemataceae bacterium]
MNKLASILIASTIGGTLFGCSSLDKALEGRTGTIQARGSSAVIKGGHCESSALTNALRAIGYDIVESDIIGGGGAPSFMFSADGFPFLGGRSSRMREVFFVASGIPYRVVVPGTAAKNSGEVSDAWKPVFALLESGIPVPLRVDMRFLPYLYGGKYGPSYMEFGWHWITLFAVDFDKRIALVSDTEHSGLQEIRIVDLDKARHSKTKVWPPRAEFVELSRPASPTAPTINRRSLIDAAFKTIIDNYEGRDTWTDSSTAAAKPLPIPTGLAGIEAFPAALRDFDQYAKPWIASPALSLLAGCIERNGTGGAAFRVLFRDFIEKSAAALSDTDRAGGDRLRTLLPALDSSIAAWRALAVEFDAAAAAVTAKMKPAERNVFYERCAAKAEALAKAERDLYTQIVTL